MIAAASQDGEDLGIYDFRSCEGPDELRREIAWAFAQAAPPVGDWTSESSCRTYFKFATHFLRFVREKYPDVEAARHVTPAVWKAWMLAASAGVRLRPVLLRIPGLPQATREAMRTRGTRQRATAKVSSHSTEEFRAIRQAAQAKVRVAEIRIREGRILLERWRDGEFEPGTDEDLWGRALHHVSETADAPRNGDAVRGAISRPLRRLVGGSGAGHHFWRRLFPTFEEMGAAAILLCCHDGWNFTTLARMDVPDHRPNGETEDEDAVIQRVSTQKARRPRRLRHGSNNLVDLGEGSAGRAMRQVVFITEQARATRAALGRPTERLLIARRFTPVEGEPFGMGAGSLEQAVKDWSKAAAMLTAEGTPLSLSPQRIHRTVQVLYGGPRHNTSQVSDDTYRLRDAQVRDGAATVVAKGLQAAVDDAVEKVRMRLVRHTGESEEQAARLAGQTGIALDTAKQVMAGDLDTAVGSCTDFEHSPFTPQGPCSVSFLMCFACPNAIATERHLPRILYLQAAIDSLRSVVSEAVWDADWSAHHDRISDLVKTHTREDERPALRARLTEADRGLVDRMLERRLDA
ncbi:hypothetical protein AQJ67_25745 [Streptomyces caeruleatus]|uniref:Uncharacterized protein n=1 Tax=Streptomyces caeruleatus TaxID=661399 RepID=A0A117RMT5_9ACTN|nr:hypothetical protein AQJ67_25745 [Streptomyces caeruleatus]